MELPEWVIKHMAKADKRKPTPMTEHEKEKWAVPIGMADKFPQPEPKPAKK